MLFKAVKGAVLQVTSVPKKPVNISVRDVWNSDLFYTPTPILHSLSAIAATLAQVQFLNCSIEEALKKSSRNVALPIAHSFKLLEIISQIELARNMERFSGKYMT